MCSRRAVRRCIFMGGEKDQLGESARVLEVPGKNLEVLQAASLRSCGMLLLALFGQCVAFSVGFSGWNGAHALGLFDGLYPGALHSSKACLPESLGGSPEEGTRMVCRWSCQQVAASPSLV